jgi:hypothetical protein
MIRFVQQISSVDFQKEEQDHACWESPGFRVAGMVWDKRDQEVADLQGGGKTFPEATVLSTMHLHYPIGKCVVSFLRPWLLQVQMQVQSRFRGRKVDLGVAAYAAAMMQMKTFGFMNMGVASKKSS